MVATEDGDARGVADLEGNEECYGFDRVVATVYIVTYSRVSQASDRGEVRC